jgi:hypothetical protein
MLVSFPLLDIPNMYLPGFAVLFSAGFCSCLVGLNVSASLKSVVAIYILVPLLLIPQMLLCGSVIDFNELSSRDNPDNYVPMYAGIMPSRWGYEALITEQYANNEYMEPLFEVDCKLRQIDFDLDYRLEEIKSLADRPFMHADNSDKKNNDKEVLRTARNEIRKLETRLGMDAGLTEGDFDPGTYGRDEQKKIRTFVLAASKHLRNDRRTLFEAKQQIRKDRKTALGREGIKALKNNHTNESVIHVVLGSMGLTSLRVQGGHVVQLSSPICKPPSSPWGRAHFGTATKRLGTIQIPTLWFNLGMLWLLTLLLYLCLYGDVINRISTRVGRFLGKRS